MQLLGILLVIAIAIGLVVTYWYVAAAVALAWLLVRVARHVLKERYFASEEFQAHARRIASIVAEHNEVSEYASEIRARGLFQLSATSRGAQSHLATFENTSRHKYQRDRNLADYQSTSVHNCSLQVVRNASADPVRYVMKYFNLRPEERTLEEVERYSNSISSLNAALQNLKEREADIAGSIDPPPFILKHYNEEFMTRVGVTLSPIEVHYPVYIFEYVSAGGNSSQRATVTLDLRTADALIETMGEKIRFKASAAGQRALMTAKLRKLIKERDHHTCQNAACRASLRQEPHLLLEVDHIKPVSKGGLSTPTNLQTLCWRCNRTKSNKEIVT